MIIKNAKIYTPRHTFEEGDLFIRDGRIVPFAQPEEGEEVVDAAGAYALPGLVDIHFHGAMGKDFWVTGISRNLTEGTAVLKLREI